MDNYNLFGTLDFPHLLTLGLRSWGWGQRLPAPPEDQGVERSEVCTTGVLQYVTQQCFRAGNLASGPDFGRILVGKASTSALRPASGRQEDQFCD